MFKSLFKRKRSRPVSAKTGKAAQTDTAIRSSETTPIKAAFDRQQSIELEDSHYIHIIGADALTSDKLNLDERNFIQSIKEIIDSESSIEDEIPRLPVLLPKLLKMLRSDDVSWKSVVEVISQDSVLVAGVIKVANSSFYRLNVDAVDLKKIVVHLGQRGVREVVTSVALKPIMQLKGSVTLQNSAKIIWSHSLKSAIASRAVADTFQVNMYDAYLAGLLHNVGMTVILKKLATTPSLNDIPCSHLFKEQIINLSKQLSLKIIRIWNMPKPTIDAVNDQIDWDGSDQFSALGDALFCGKSISMRHTLLADGSWKDQFSNSIALQNFSNHKSFQQAFDELNQLEK